jgi:hypothetical protein
METKMLLKPFLPNKEQGTITVFFLMFAIVLVGAISYSLYFAHAANEKIKIENATDSETQAMAAQAAKGLNMIAANNLAIGASIHIAASLPILSRYIALTRGALSTCGDLGDNLSVLVGEDGPYQAYFDWFAPVSKLYLNAASGMTTLNSKLAKYWLSPTALRGMEVLRLNAAGAITLPLQISQIAKFKENPVSALLFSYEGLRQTTPHHTLCHTFSASNGLSGLDRNNPLFWLGGPFESFGGSGNFGAEAEGLQSKATQIQRDTEKQMNDTIKKNEWACKRDNNGFLLDKKRCEDLQKVKNAKEKLDGAKDDGSLFGFGSCGIGGGGNFAKQAEHKFGDDDSMGFVYPDPESDDSYSFFEKSLNFAALSGLAFRVKDEADSICPSEWIQTIDGKQVCKSTSLWHFESNKKQLNDLEYNVAIGSMVNLLKDPDSLKSGWSKTKWTISQARAYYDPSGHDPTTNVTKMKLFWPAWRAKLTKPTVLKELTDLLF